MLIPVPAVRCDRPADPHTVSLLSADGYRLTATGYRPTSGATSSASSVIVSSSSPSS